MDTPTGAGSTPYDRQYYESGKLKHEAPLLDGKEHGLVRDFYESGAIEWETPCFHGIPHGMKRRYSEEGRLLQELSYVHGRLTGTRRFYYDNGALREEVELQDGDLHGLRRLFDPQGNHLHTERWEHGTGIRREYDRCGRLLREEHYRGGLKHGPAREYDEQGNQAREWHYVEGCRRAGSLSLRERAGVRALQGGVWPGPAPSPHPSPGGRGGMDLSTPGRGSCKSGYADEFNAKRAAALERVLGRSECHDPHTALVLLKHGVALDRVNAFLAGKVKPLNPRSLDLQVYYQLLALADRGLSGEARAHVAGLCDRHYNATLPAYVSLERPFDPWNYLLCNCPTENHLCNDMANRLAECVVFPHRVFSDGHSAAEYRPYWEGAFRQFVASRVRYGMREWRPSVYCHVFFDDAMMVYNLMPPGLTREAARVFLDYLFLSIAIGLRNGMWTGPHSRVYNSRGGCTIGDFSTQCYPPYARQLTGEEFLAPILVSDYVVPEAVARLPFRQDRYVSIEKVGPRFRPRGQGEGVFNPDRRNVWICQADREDWGGDGILYSYLSPRFSLGSVQDWGPYDGEWHMHCLPWCLMIASGESTDIVLSFTGSEAEATHQGGYMTWANDSNDQDATIFQHRKTLFCQMRGWRQEKLVELLPGGYPEVPSPPMRFRYVAPIGDRTRFQSRFYVAHSLGKLVFEGGWLLGELVPVAGNGRGVCFAIRPVRGGFREEKQSDWVLGRVYVCDIWDDVILLEVAETEELGSFEDFRRRVLAAPLSFDARRVTFRNLEGDVLTFCWKEDGDPTVNGSVPDYGGMRFRDPCVRSARDSGVIEVGCAGARVILRAEGPDQIRREEL